MEKRIISKENIEDKNIFLKLYESILKSKKLKPLDKLIYTLIRNRLNLSIENEIKNEDGNYYIYYSQEDIADFVDCSTKSVINSFERLRENNYIKTEKQKNGALKIFFYEIECNKYEKKEIEILENQNETHSTLLISEPVVEVPQEKISQPSVKFSDGSEKSSYKKEINNNNKINKKENFKYSDNIISHHIYHNPIKDINPEVIDMIKNYDRELLLLKQQIEYDDLVIAYSKDIELIDEFILTCIDMLTSEYTYINKQAKPLSVIRSVLKRLSCSHIIEMVYKFNSLTTKINNVQGYIKTMIYNSCISLKASIDNQVKYDMYGTNI